MDCERRVVTEYFKVGDHSYMDSHQSELADFVLNLIGGDPPGLTGNTAIEFGAGAGRFSPALTERFRKVFLVEPAPDYARELRVRFKENSKIDVVECTASQFIETYKSEGLKDTMVFSFHLLHHISKEERQIIFKFVQEESLAGVFVEPNPYNPLVLLQILLHPRMRFREERQYLRLTPATLSQEMAVAKAKISNLGFICALPPFLMQALLKSGRIRLAKFIERFFLTPITASYHFFLITKEPKNEEASN